LAVTLRFAGAVDPKYYYYILIRNAPDNEGLNPTNGPIPVLSAAAGNGFATDLHTGAGTAAFTDFVLFGGGGQPTSSGYGLYHVQGYLHADVNTATFILSSQPDVAVHPGNGDNSLTFELSLDRLRPAAGECQASVPNDCPTAKFLNINVVATTVLSVDPHNFDPRKFVDAFGDQSAGVGSGSINAVVTVDTSRLGQVYQSSATAGGPFYEPDNDTYPNLNDQAIELVAWQIQVKQ